MADVIRAILFDMDGVLVNAKEWHFTALNEALRGFGYDLISHEDHLARFDGLPTMKKLALLGECQVIPPSQFKDINALKQKLTLEIAREKCQPEPQHVESLRKLKAAGYRMAVCSNSMRASVDLFMDKTALRPFLDLMLSNEDIKLPKPDPEIYLTAMKRLGVAPKETLILEDNDYGLQSACASGAHVCEIKTIEQVTYDYIMTVIDRIEKNHQRKRAP
jgi:beta-phosphoglucomutase